MAGLALMVFMALNGKITGASDDVGSAIQKAGTEASNAAK